MSFLDWSTNPANNTSKPGIVWSEGMLPGQVNDSARGMMADMATWLTAPSFPSGLTATGSVVATTLRGSGYILGTTNETSIGYDQGAGFVLAYNGGTATYLPLRLIGSTIALSPAGTAVLTATASAVTSTVPASFPSLTLTNALPVTQGGTGAATAAAARANLGLGTIATQDASSYLGATAQAVDSARLGGVLPAPVSSTITSASWPFIPRVGVDGVMEIGKHIDFHDSGTSTDYDVRISVTSGNLGISAPVSVPSLSSSGLVTAGTGMTVGGNEVFHRGNLNPSNYATTSQLAAKQDALGYTPYNATNPSGYISGITGAMVNSALGYTPYNGTTNPNSYISGISGAQVVAALGFTPANRGGDTFTGAINRDANFSIDIVSSRPRITFDSGDYLEYDRTNNKLFLTIGGSAVASVDSTGTLRVVGNVIGSTTP